MYIIIMILRWSLDIESKSNLDVKKCQIDLHTQLDFRKGNKIILAGQMYVFLKVLSKSNDS